MNYDIIHMVHTHGEDGTGNAMPVMDVLKRLGRHRKKFTVSLLTAATLIKKLSMAMYTFYRGISDCL